MGDRPDDADLAAVATLATGTRRDLYLLTLAPEGVTADRGADRLGISRSTAVHHLERLLDEGLVEASFERLTGRSGPGAGRPAKIYRGADREVDVTIPPRQYRLAADLLARAVAASGMTTEALVGIARAAGQDIGTRAADRSAGAVGNRDAVALLRERGAMPERLDDGTVVLRNCPFKGLVAGNEEVVCAMHEALTAGVLEGLGAGDLRIERGHRPDACCVALRPA